MANLCQEHQVWLLAYGTLCGGFPSDKYRYFLDKPKVAGGVVGIRLGLSDHRKDNASVSGLQFDAQDLEQMELVLGRSNDLYRVIGD